MISLVKYLDEAMGTFGKVATGLGAGTLYTIGALSSRGENIPKINTDNLSNLRKVVPKPNIDNLPKKPNIPLVNSDRKPNFRPMTDKEKEIEARRDARDEAKFKRAKQQAQQLKDAGRTSGTFVGGKLQPEGYDDSNLTMQQKIERAAKNQRPSIG